MHRINVNFSGEAYDTLKDIAESQGKTMSEVLRDAITLEKWIHEVRQSGGRVLIEKDGKRRELLIR